ncbi:MAG: hypothetical protein FWF90_17260 [Promicromonosporaceae bacterium]|nr:hypothetical protein [Promicromonosporaceae bacterium]
MSNHQPYPGDDDPGMGDHLSRLYSALAGDAARHGHLDIEQTIKRVRRRRAAKATAITASTLVLVAALGAGAWAQPWQWQNTPTPPATQTPTPAPTDSPSPTPSGTPSGDPIPDATSSDPSSSTPATRVGVPADRSALDDPRFHPGQMGPDAEWGCGADLQDTLAGSTTDAFTIQIVGDPTYPTPGGFASMMARTRVTNTSGQGLATGYTAGGPLLMWTQDGKIVDWKGWHEGGDPWHTTDEWNADGTWNEPAYESSAVTDLPSGSSFDAFAFGVAAGTDGWTCGTSVPNDNDLYPNFPDALPAGDYQVYAISWYWTDAGVQGSVGPQYLVSPPITVTVP